MIFRRARGIRLTALALVLAACSDDPSAEPNAPGGDDRPGQPDDPPLDDPKSDLSVTIVEPQAGAILRGPKTVVRARLASARPLLDAAIILDGRSSPINLVSRERDGSIVVEIATEDGDHQLEITSRDDQGKSASATVAFLQDGTGPSLDLVAPIRGFSETRRLLQGTVSDPRGLKKVSYKVEGQAAVDVPVANSAKSVPLHAVLPLRPGANKLTVELEDAIGNKRTETIDFRYGLSTTAGGAHSATLVNDILYVWGRNNLGQLGLGDAASRLSPIAQAAFGDPAKTVAAVAFNQNDSLAIATDGSVWMWGANGDGQLGQGDTTNRSLPIQVANETAIYGVTGYGHALVLHADGTVDAWGDNGKGQIGDGTADASKTTPVAVAGLPTDIVKIAAGSEHSIALSADGSVWIWGANQSGQLGGGASDALAHPTATKIAALTDIIDVATGGNHLLALKADGTVSSWGLGKSGQLGYGENTDPAGEDRTSPVAVVKDAAGTKLDGVLAVFANGNSSYALTKNKQYFGWGQNYSGQLAIGKTTSVEWRPIRAALHDEGATPKYLDEIVDIRAIGNGATHTIARATTGETYAWGWSFQGSLGVSSMADRWAQTKPVLVTMP